MHKPDIVFIRAGQPDDLHPDTEDLSLDSMQQAHRLGSELKDRGLLPQRTFCFGSRLSQITAEIIIRATGHIARVELHPLQPVPDLVNQSICDWLDEELSSVINNYSRHSFNRLLCVAPHLLIAAVDRLVAHDRRCLQFIPHHEGFVCSYSPQLRHYTITEPIGFETTLQLVCSQPPP